ncbi:MAG TPA: DUF2818 family protein [Burkholderiales bacterium]|nr:DUF2818 family protein [Burkholderiales bacterium]
MELGQIILIFIALVAANLPFVTERIFFVIPPSVLDPKAPKQDNPSIGEVVPKSKTAAEKTKHLGWRFLELVVLYFLVGGAGYLLESRLGAPHSQRWEFYAITACLFLVFAYPGFVARYLWNPRGR